MEQVKVIAPAKINLSLDITGVDEKGYHLLDMIMQTVSVFEYVTLTKQDKITMASNAKFIPTDSKNTAVKAAMKFFEYTGINGGVHIHIKKNVPIKAGMAGGSADAAGVIVGLNHMYGTKLTIDQMCEIGLMCGSDIPFMIHGGTKRIQGTGDIILPCPQMPEYPLVICMPANGVSTPQAYANYDANGIKTLVETDKLVDAIKDKNLADIAKYMANDLESAAGSDETQPIREELIRLGAIGSMMTGSGAAVFGVFDDEEKAKAAAEELKTAQLSQKLNLRSVFVAKPVPFGASVMKK
ncbi:MAG: 4-(cytidine 5'-diphospho)-2-C-methyl-D-erythritol kinase [Oscillospiraceae bacterium]|nr:4-(cytidine 5'-diphospho)-2-C-methyl-D-erythritol kinase [Oscillospiraceae bacterium]